MTTRDDLERIIKDVLRLVRSEVEGKGAYTEGYRDGATNMALELRARLSTLSKDETEDQP